MRSRAAKAILNNILWSGILAGVACFGVLVTFGFGVDNLGPDSFAVVASVAFTAGLIAFAIYREITIKRLPPIVNIVLSAIIWSFALAIYGGIGVSVLGAWILNCAGGDCALVESSTIVVGSVPISFGAGLIVLTLYGLTRHPRFDRKRQDTRAILKNILWSAILAGVACFGVLVMFGFEVDTVDPLFFALVASVAFPAGLIAFAIYREITIKKLPPIVNIVLSAIIWSFALAIYGGIGVSILGAWVWGCFIDGCGSFGDDSIIVVGSVYVSFGAGLIVLTLYGLTRHLRFDREQQDTSHHPVHPKKKRIALIGLSVLLLGVVPPGLAILDPVDFRNNDADTSAAESGECESRPLRLRITESLETLEYLDDHVDSDKYWVFHDEDNSVWIRVAKERSPLIVISTNITLRGEARRLSWRSQAYFSQARCDKLADCTDPDQFVGEFEVSGVSFDGEDPHTGNFMERLRETLLPLVQEQERQRQRENEEAHQRGVISCLFWANRGRGRDNAEMGNYQEAISDFDKALEFKPGNIDVVYYIDVYYRRGKAKAELGNYQGAIADYDKVIELELNLRMSVTVEIGDDRTIMIPASPDSDYSARLTYETTTLEPVSYVSTLPPEFTYGVSISGSSSSSGVSIKVVEGEEQLEWFNNRFSSKYKDRGIANVKLGKYQEAISDFDKALEFKPDNADARYHRGLAETELSNH